MVHRLRRGENTSLTALAPDASRVSVGVGWELDVVAGTLDADVFAVLLGADGQVLSDGHLVFYNNDASPEGAVRLSGGIEGGEPGSDRQRLVVDLAGAPPEVERILVALAVYGVGEAAEEPRTLRDVRDLYLRVLADPAEGTVDAGTGPADGTELVRYDIELATTIENALVLGEVYRLGEEWKVVATAQGYASGLRGVATDFGVHV